MCPWLYLPWPPEAPCPADELPAEDEDVVPVLAAAAGAELTPLDTDGELDMAPEYPPCVDPMDGKLLPPLYPPPIGICVGGGGV